MALIIGTFLSELRYGTTENDTILSQGGNDTVLAGFGDDSIDLGWGNDIGYGQDGDDTINGSLGNDTLLGGNGADYLTDLDGSNTLVGGAGDDTLVAGAGADDLEGDGGHDFLVGGDGIDRLIGGDGNDSIYGQGSSDSIIGGNGRDFIRGGAGGDLILGGFDADFIFGGLGGDSILGERGNDTIHGGDEAGDGNDTLNGGPGNDVMHGGDGDDLMYGAAGRDRMIGDAGVDTLRGGDGDDQLYVTFDGDLLDGEGGHDALVVASAPIGADDTLIWDATSQTLSYETPEGFVVDFPERIRNMESFVTQNVFNDHRIYGSDLDEAFTTSPATRSNDTVYGAGGSDTISVNDGDAFIDGGPGDDLVKTIVVPGSRIEVIGGPGSDLFQISSQYSSFPLFTSLFVDLEEDAFSFTVDPSVAAPEISISGIEDILLYLQVDIMVLGTAEENYLLTADGNDTMFGRAGDDRLLSGPGDDLFVGGAGADLIQDYGGTDTVSFEDATGRVVVDLLRPEIAFGDAVGDVYEGIEVFQGSDFNDQLRGGAEGDIFYGGGSSDRLYGRAGDDVLFGEDGTDALFGGRGADTMTGGDDSGRRDRYIYFNAVETGVGDGNRDVITDFVSGEDRIELRRIDADVTQGFKQGFDFIGDAAFSGTAGELRYEQVGGNTIVQADRDGDAAADFEIELTGTMTLTESDFLI